MTDLPALGACGSCDAPSRGHAIRWHPDAGWHTWNEPSEAQVKARTRAIVAALKEKRSEQLGESDL